MTLRKIQVRCLSAIFDRFSNGEFVPRRLWLSIAFLLAAAACASPGPTNDPILRTGTWFSYLAGEDVRASCGGTGSPEYYRAVYNGIYREQVRTYDVSQEFSGDRGIMVARVFQGTVRLTRKPIPGASFLGDRARTVISQAEFVAIRRALERGGAFAADPATLFLRSDTFYWTVAACSGGRFHFRAFKGPPQHLERLPFAAILFRLDETGAPYNRPRRTDIDRLTNYGRISEPPSQSNFVTFELKATAGGLQ